MRDESIFRIVAVRGPEVPASVPVGRRPLDFQADPSTPFQRRIAAALAAAAGADEARRIAAEQRASSAYVRHLGGLRFKVALLLAWARNRGGTPIRDIDFAAEIPQALDSTTTLVDLVGSADFTATFTALSDSAVADSVVGEAGPAGQPLLAALKLMELLRRAAAENGRVDSEATIGSLLDGLIVIAPAPRRQDLGQTVQPPSVPERPSIVVPDRAAVLGRLGKLLEAKKDFSTAVRLKGSLQLPQTATAPLAESATRQASLLNQQTAAVTAAARAVTGLNVNITELGTRAISQAAILAVPSGDHIMAAKSSPVLTAGAIGRLKPVTREVLTGLGLRTEDLGPGRAMSLMERELLSLSGQLTTAKTATPMVAFAGGFINKELMVKAFGFGKYMGLLPGLIEKCQYAVGIADLLIVRQKLKAYELGDFAHVENALKGELREREHRRLNLTEETTELISEQEMEKERNLQSTERNEMQTEASKQVKSDAGIEAGLTVSGSYGPTVSFTASVNGHFSTSTQETQRKATSFSREVTEKTSEKIRTRVQEERRRRVLEQIEELNRHKIDNTAGLGHTRGIYRWLNKIYDAQVFNYGKRMMYEFVVPEPAAFLIYSLIDNPPADTDLPPKPEPPTFAGSPLKPENLDVDNYQDYVAQYGVTGAPVPPSEFKFVSHFDKLESAENVAVGRSAKVAVPDGYEAFGAYLHNYKNWKGDQPATFKVTLGGENFDYTGVWGNTWVDFAEPFRSEISITYGGIRVLAFGLGVDIYCGLTSEGFAKWQRDAYDAIMQGYDRLRGDYEEKLAASKIAQGVKIIGRNPLENQRMIRDELKKWTIMVLRGSPYLDLDSFLNSTEPTLSISKACKNGNLIRFFENAFEWNNLSFVLYPYFWGRHARWSAALQFSDPDPDFAGFLKAGAARVQVPVRPGFEKAVAYFSDTGQIWNGSDPPLIGDSLYVPIVQEITESLGKIDDGVPYPEGSEPWEVTVPTSLVVLQDLTEIAAIRDGMTDQPINLLTAPA
jgi:hypothetical protein